MESRWKVEFMSKKPTRMLRETKTIDCMFDIYCQDTHHRTTGLCDSCQVLKDYAHLRLEKCPYQEKKATCAHCPTHCYKKSMRESIREVMRYAGPRMLFKHPLLAILHLLDGMRKPPSILEIKTRSNNP